VFVLVISIHQDSILFLLQCFWKERTTITITLYVQDSVVIIAAYFKMVKMQLAVMSLTRSVKCFTQTIFLIIGNCIIKITSRKFISKLLLKLPSQFFPCYRVVVSAVIIQDNLKRRSMMPPTIYSSSSSDEEDDGSSTNVGRCKCIRVLQKAYYYHGKTDHSDESSDESSQENLDACESTLDIQFHEKGFVKFSNEYVEILEENVVEKCHVEPPGTPPLRRITASDLASVHLRPSKDYERTPRTPEVSDMLNILRRRYAVLHYSPASSNNSFSDLSECEYRNINSHCGNDYVDCVY
ncbi:unnamed protein product, partial [Callosobruchus maculatus]